MPPNGDHIFVLASGHGVKVVSVADGHRFSAESNTVHEWNTDNEGGSALCLTETWLKTTLLEWWSIDIFALQTVFPAIKLIRIPNFKEFTGVLLAEVGKGSVGITRSVGSPGSIFEMEPILLLSDQ